MNILVINGSPKGNGSITLQTLLFLEKAFTNHNFSFLNVGQKKQDTIKKTLMK